MMRLVGNEIGICIRTWFPLRTAILGETYSASRMVASSCLAVSRGRNVLGVLSDSRSQLRKEEPRNESMTHTGILLIVLAIAVIAVVIGGYYYSNRRRTQLLRQHFGPEYDRVVQQERNVRRAEGVLEFRAKARETFQIRPLAQSDQRVFTRRWQDVQRLFVDNPSQAVLEADRLLTDVMAARGYPVSNFEQRTEIVSVDHPDVVQNYRIAHDIAVRQTEGRLSTEDLRKAVVQFRPLFDHLLKDSVPHGRDLTSERKEARG